VAALEEVRCDVEDVARVSVETCTCPGVRRRFWSAGCEAQGKARGSLLRPGTTGKGKAGRVNDDESLLMPRESYIPGREAVPG